MAGETTTNPFDKDFTLTKDYCQKYGDCNYAGCCLLYMAMERYGIKSISFDEEEDYSGCTYIQELKWNRQKEKEEAKINNELTLKKSKEAKPSKSKQKRG